MCSTSRNGPRSQASLGSPPTIGRPDFLADWEPIPALPISEGGKAAECRPEWATSLGLHSLPSPVRLPPEEEWFETAGPRVLTVVDSKDTNPVTKVCIAIIGAPGVGKQTLWNRLHLSPNDDVFGYEGVIIQHVVDRIVYHLDICDMPEPKYPHRYLGDAETKYQRSATIIAYSVTSAESFDYAQTLLDSAMRYMVEHATPLAHPGKRWPLYPLLLLGLKTDEPGRQVVREEGERLAAQYCCLFAEASAKADTGISPALRAVVERVHQLEKACDSGLSAEELRQHRLAMIAQWWRWFYSGL